MRLYDRHYGIKQCFWALGSVDCIVGPAMLVLTVDHNLTL